MVEKKVTKIDLVQSVYHHTEYERHVIQGVVDALLLEMRSAMERGAKIELRGFGTFEPRLRKGREKARNPKTGEAVSVAPHYVTVFRAGQELKKALWDLPVES